jgi:hypothetical protein
MAPVKRVKPKKNADYEALDPQQRQQIDYLAGLFTCWPKAYDNSKHVWEVMKSDPGFDVSILISRIRLSFADFLVAAIREFMRQDGFDP